MTSWMALLTQTRLENPTFLSVLGEQAARQYARGLKDQAISALDGTELDATLLVALAHFTVERSH